MPLWLRKPPYGYGENLGQNGMLHGYALEFRGLSTCAERGPGILTHDYLYSLLYKRIHMGMGCYGDVTAVVTFPVVNPPGDRGIHWDYYLLLLALIKSKCGHAFFCT